MEEPTNKSLQSALSKLKDHSQLLDVIDLLRSQGVHHYVSVPQIIVCGDQSSGKSSVLNAISSFELPTKEGLCTRFAIEMILRRSIKKEINFAITPGADRTADERTRFASFQYPNASLNDLPDIVEKAKEVMGIGPNGRTLSDDVLRIEYLGPDQPNLTLVDLPGVIHSESKQQSAEDVRLISKLVKTYMSNPRSVILAVVSAKNDYANQIVTKLAHEVDPKGRSTLGIITKPDTLLEGSDSENSFLELAKNEQVIFRLGWHVLKNREPHEQEFTSHERDESERAFFSRRVWRVLSDNCLGAPSLKLRLSVVLRDQITSELPNLIRDVEIGIEECETRLSKLGGSRSSTHEQRLYLISLSRSFERLVKEAIDGNYNDDFFGDAKTKIGFSKRLRAVIQDSMTIFKNEMHSDGHSKEIIEDEENLGDDPKRISREDYLNGVSDLLRRNRGRELPGLFNPMIVSDLFYEQSKPWSEIVDATRSKILNSAAHCVDLVVKHISDRSTYDGLNRYIIGPAKENYAKRYQAKINEIMKPHMKGHPITHNHYFTDSILKARQQRMEKDMLSQLISNFRLPKTTTMDSTSAYSFTAGSIVASLSRISESDMDKQACSEATDAMQAYYKVAMKTLIDNFAVLATESCVLEELTAIFTSEIIEKLTDRELEEIAAETKESQTERISATTKLEVLRRGLGILRTLNTFKVQAFASDEEEDDDRKSDLSEEWNLTNDPETDGNSSAVGEQKEVDEAPAVAAAAAASEDSISSHVPQEEKGFSLDLNVPVSVSPPPAETDDIWSTLLTSKSKKKKKSKY